MDEWDRALLGVLMSTALLWLIVYIPVRLARWVAARRPHRPQSTADPLLRLTLLGAAACASSGNHHAGGLAGHCGADGHQAP